MIVCTYDNLLFSNMLYIINIALTIYETVLLSIYAQLFSLCLLAVGKRESGHTCKELFYLGKIENSSYCQELVSHSMPVY